MVIFANHAHVFPKSLRPDGSLEELQRLMETCQIDRAVAFAPFADQVQELRLEPNQWLAEELTRYPNILGFGTIDLAKPDPAKQAEAIAALGFKGIKLHPRLPEVQPRRRRAGELLRRCGGAGAVYLYPHGSPLAPAQGLPSPALR